MTARAFTMPKWGIEMREGTLAKWLVSEGQAFARGDLLALVETDKITNEIEAEFDGVLRRAVVAEGATVPVGALLAVFADADVADAEVEAVTRQFGAAAPAITERADPAPAPALPATEMVASAPTPVAARAPMPDDAAISLAARAAADAAGVDVSALDGSGRGGRITHQDVTQAARAPAAPALTGPLPLGPERAFASPLAHRLAGRHGIDLTALTGTGPRGRISQADVLARVSPAAAPTAAPTIVPMGALQRTVARRLTLAKTTIPHFYLRAEVRTDALAAMREAANLVLGAKASLNDCLVRAAALALVDVPEVNIQVHGDAVHRFASADIAVAVASPRGLVTPIVRGAERLRPHEIGAAVRALARKAEAGRLAIDDIEGGSFTVSNLGMFGVDQFDAIINPPHGAILAVGAARRVFAEQADGTGRFEGRIALSLSCDHRAIDGGTGARLLAALRALIETPARLFAPAQ